MGTLADIRASLVDALGTDKAPAFDHLPQRLNPPAKVIEPSEPYITDEAEGLVFGQVQVSFDVFVLARPATNQTQVAELDKHLEEVLALVDATDEWSVRSVGQPFVLAFGDTVQYLTTVVRVTTDTTL